MTLYLCLFLIGALLSWTIADRDRILHNIFIKAYLLFLFLFVGLRYQIGGDWYSYIFLFDSIRSLPLLDSLSLTDPGYAIVNKISYNVYIVNLICAFIFFWGVGSFCLRQYRPWIGLMVAFPYLILVVSMGYTRQSAAIGFAFLAFISLLDKKSKKYILYVLLGAAFHKTAIVLLLFYPITKNEIKVRNVIYISIALFGLIFLFLFDRIMASWQLYIEDGMDSGGGLVRVIVGAIPAFIFLFYRKKWRCNYPESYFFMIILSVISVFFIPLQFIASTFVDRFALYFIVLQVLLYSNLARIFNFHYRMLLEIFTLTFYFVFLIYWLSFSYYAQCCWLPYNNIIYSVF